MPRAAASRSANAPQRRPARAGADVLDRRAGARVRPDDAGDPLLRGLRPARAAARRQEPRLHGARPGAPDAHAARQAARPEARRGEGAGRHVREPARHRRAAAPLPRRAGAPSRPARGAPRPSCARRSTRSSRRRRRRGRCSRKRGEGMTGAPAFPAALTDARAFAHRARDARRLRPPLPAVPPGERARPSSASRRPTGTASSGRRRERIEFYDLRVDEATERLQSEFEAGDAADGRLAAGQAALHRPADQPPPARAAPRPSSTR